MTGLAEEIVGSLADARREAEEKVAALRGKPVERIQPESEGEETKPQQTTAEVARPTPPVAAPAPKMKDKPLLFFNFPVQGFEDLPSWARPLREALLQAGYMIYMPEVTLESQFGNADVVALNALQKRIVPTMCRMLRLPEELTLPFDSPAVLGNLRNADTGKDSDASVFKDLWFLSRSSLMIADLVRDQRGIGFGQKILYSRFFDVPVIGISPVGGVLNPWVQKSVSVLFTDQFNIANIMPLVRGYAPLG